ncbi:MAG: 5-formyltetrahydrofolate cyclo-ligase [Betaproteobacteria bacterium]|nr:5-formyltetrahydrofolate cyclo-ligase [Betaproteobacteria bacterium]
MKIELSVGIAMRIETRKRCLLARETLAGDEVARRSAFLTEHLLRAFPRPPGERVAFYWPMRNEPDVRQAIHVWLKMGVTAALPVVRGQSLVFRVWQPDSMLLPDAKGVPAPRDDAPEVIPDALLIPLNAFDALGFRLGYGGGFFDRALAAMTAKAARPLAIGIGFELGRVDDVEPQPHDQPMDWLITEAGFWRVA